MTEQRFKTFAALRDFYRPLDKPKGTDMRRRAFTLIAEPNLDGWTVRALEAPDITASAPLAMDALLRIGPAIAAWANGQDGPEDSADATDASIDA